jgi:hypothetical protein
MEISKPLDRRDTIEQEQQLTRILVDRRDLELEHSNLLERLHQLRRLLGFPPLLTGKKQRELR